MRNYEDANNFRVHVAEEEKLSVKQEVCDAGGGRSGVPHLLRSFVLWMLQLCIYMITGYIQMLFFQYDFYMGQ